MKAKLNNSVIVRVESDDYAMVFDADSGNSFAITPTAVFIANLLDGENTVVSIINKMKEEYEGIPENAEMVVEKFIETLIEKGMAEKTED